MGFSLFRSSFPTTHTTAELTENHLFQTQRGFALDIVSILAKPMSQNEQAGKMEPPWGIPGHSFLQNYCHHYCYRHKVCRMLAPPRNMKKRLNFGFISLRFFSIILNVSPACFRYYIIIGSKRSCPTWMGSAFSFLSVSVCWIPTSEKSRVSYSDRYVPTKPASAEIPNKVGALLLESHLNAF